MKRVYRGLEYWKFYLLYISAGIATGIYLIVR
jgi:hypothetical protein